MPFIKGQPSWNKGKPRSEETKRKISLNSAKYWSSHTMSKEIRKIMSLAQKKRFKTSSPWNKGIHHMQGSNHPMWKGGITPNSLSERNRFRNELQKQIFERDNYTCQLCGIKNGNGKTIRLQIDHIQKWSEYVELRFSMDNCRTLCQECHYKITWGKEMPKTIKTWGHNLKEVTNH